MSNHEDPSQLQGQLQGQGQANLQGQGQGQLNLQGQGQGQGQGQANLQGQGQGQLQGQADLQGQGQGQDQAQSEAQTAAQAVGQSVDSSSSNDNLNGNGNGNLNGNGNFDANGNLNGNGNFNGNDNTNHLSNDLNNTANNTAVNQDSNINNVQNHVDTSVDVKVNVDLSGIDLKPVNDASINVGEHNDGIVFSMPSDVYQTVQDGATFNLDQVNNLVASNHLEGAAVSYMASSDGGSGLGAAGGSAGFSMAADAHGGAASNGIATAEAHDSSPASISTAADAPITQDAFTQSIVMGANIQFNSASFSFVGHDMGDHGAVVGHA